MRAFLNFPRDLHIKFDRNELAGAFGDLGTLIPLVTGIIAINGMSPVNIMLSMGIFYILCGFVFGVPMAVQPMKAVAVLAITEGVTPTIIIGAGFFVGLFFLLAAFSGLLGFIERIIPKSVIRGIQLALGLKMAILALHYMSLNHPWEGVLANIEILRFLPMNWVVSIGGIVIVLFLFRSRKVPAALMVLMFGVSMSLLNGFPLSLLFNGIEMNLPMTIQPSFNDLILGTILLGIPQIPLTIGNAIIATKSFFQTLFPQRKPITTKKLALTTGAMNLASAMIGGIPMCHGSGGLAGHYRFGARTGGASIIIGALLILLGVFYGKVLIDIFSLLPIGILGVLLFFAGLELTLSVRDLDFKNKNDVFILLFVTAICLGTQHYSFILGFIGGVSLFHLTRKRIICLFEDVY
jgi:MFS superfamily sulfate permease-like transporter